MCPVYNPSTSECKVTPVSDARQDGNYKDHYCVGGNNLRVLQYLEKRNSGGNNDGLLESG